MEIKIEDITYQDAVDLDKKTCKISIDGDLIGYGFKLTTDGRKDIGDILTMGVEYMIATISHKQGYYVVALISDYDPVVIKAGKIR